MKPYTDTHEIRRLDITFVIIGSNDVSQLNGPSRLVGVKAHLAAPATSLSSFAVPYRLLPVQQARVEAPV